MPLEKFKAPFFLAREFGLAGERSVEFRIMRYLNEDKLLECESDAVGRDVLSSESAGEKSRIIIRSSQCEAHSKS